MVCGLAMLAIASPRLVQAIEVAYTLSEAGNSRLQVMLYDTSPISGIARTVGWKVAIRNACNRPV